MPTTVVSRSAQPLTADAFTALGWIPVADTDPVDGAQTLHFEWADPHLNVISHAASEIEHTEAGAPLCTVLYRHATHTQALLVLNVDAVVACAPAEVTFARPSDLDAIQVFRLRPLDAFVLHRGTWHWGPFPLGTEPVRLWNVQGRRYAEDNDCVDLLDQVGAALEVLA
jgi:ureidoglycolate hydrolase